LEEKRINCCKVFEILLELGRVEGKEYVGDRFTEDARVPYSKLPFVHLGQTLIMS
jgi:hypothetical protein